MKYEISRFVKDQLPRHFTDDNPRFIRLLDCYYKWLYRKDGMSYEEIADVKSNINKWSKIDIDRFILTESPRFNISDEDIVISEITQWKAPGAKIDRLHSQFILEREFDSFITSDGDYFLDNDDMVVESGAILEDVIENWSNKFNHVRSGGIDVLNPHDEILLLKCMKMIYAAKGTNKCIKLFFKVYFDEDVDVYIPKFDICTIDDVPVIDTNKYIRDDYKYQEYCYCIRTNNDPEPYRDIFNRIYLNQFHPGGFNVILEKKP